MDFGMLVRCHDGCVVALVLLKGGLSSGSLLEENKQEPGKHEEIGSIEANNTLDLTS